MGANTVIVWFRQDLRLADNPALHYAVQSGASVIPVYIWAQDEEGAWAPGAASRVWLHASLLELQKSLGALNSRLLFRKGATLGNLRNLLKTGGAQAVYWNRRYEPHAIARDRHIQEDLQANGIEVKIFGGSLLLEPENFHNKLGGPYKVFTPFYRAALRQEPPQTPLPKPTHLPQPQKWPKSEALTALGLLPRIDWTKGIRTAWTPGEASANQAMDEFLGNALDRYPKERDMPYLPSVSRLSPYLHFGEISPRQILYKLQERGAGGEIEAAAETYIRQVYWREFAYYLLCHFPHTTDTPLRENFAKFAWREDEKLLAAWQSGSTGYPLVDAGMRELWVTGWMHNRVRMVTASFLVKDLLQPWQSGAQWFWDTLVDADLANNTLGWQWVAGCGADAAPYFRIFNPVSQSEKFDPKGIYIRKWMPELALLPDKWLHRPWAAPEAVLINAGVKLGTNYPAPIVDHDWARKRALAAYAQLK